MRESAKRSGPAVSRARSAAVEILTEFSRTLKPVNLLLRDFAASNQNPARDTALLSEIVYGATRWQIQSDWLLSQFIHGDLEDYPLSIQTILRCAVYQIVHLDGIPDYAVVNEAVSLSSYFREIKYARLVNAVLRNFLRNRKKIVFPDSKEDRAEHLSVKYAYPRWMVGLFLSHYDFAKTETILEVQNRRPDITLRINAQKNSIGDFKELLAAQKVGFSEANCLPEFVRLTGFSGSVQGLPGYREGFFSVQDESAGFVSHAANPAQHGIVADICSAPGGKATHMAELSGDNGTIVAIDLSEARLRMTQSNLRRLGFNSIKLVRGDAAELSVRGFDLAVLDAPCSGLGVIRKNPDIKIRRKPHHIDAARETQAKILREAARALEMNGALIYSTCSINPQENEDMIREFLSSNPEFSIESLSDVASGPSFQNEGWINTVNELSDMDGSFCVRLRKGNRNGL